MKGRGTSRGFPSHPSGGSVGCTRGTGLHAAKSGSDAATLSALRREPLRCGSKARRLSSSTTGPTWTTSPSRTSLSPRLSPSNSCHEFPPPPTRPIPSLPFVCFLVFFPSHLFLALVCILAFSTHISVPLCCIVSHLYAHISCLLSHTDSFCTIICNLSSVLYIL